MTLFEMDVLPGGAVPVPHHPVGFDEVLHGTAGRLRVTVDGQAVEVGAGEALLISADPGGRRGARVPEPV